VGSCRQFHHGVLTIRAKSRASSSSEHSAMERKKYNAPPWCQPLAHDKRPPSESNKNVLWITAQRGSQTSGHGIQNGLFMTS
jgi:hypothetical protein